jgi:ribosome-associated protein
LLLIQNFDRKRQRRVDEPITAFEFDAITHHHHRRPAPDLCIVSPDNQMMSSRFVTFLCLLLHGVITTTSAWTVVGRPVSLRQCPTTPGTVAPQRQPRQSCSRLWDNKARHEQQTDFMEKGLSSVVGDMPDLTDDLELVRTIVKAGDGRKAEDIVGLQVAQVSTLTSFMVFLSGNSRPQNQAIAAAITDDVEAKFGLVRNPQGTADSGWMVLDYGSVMVHIMTPKSRLFYNVEGQVRSMGKIL